MDKDEFKQLLKREAGDVKRLWNSDWLAAFVIWAIGALTATAFIFTFVKT